MGCRRRSAARASRARVAAFSFASSCSWAACHSAAGTTFGRGLRLSGMTEALLDETEGVFPRTKAGARFRHGRSDLPWRLQGKEQEMALQRLAVPLLVSFVLGMLAACSREKPPAQTLDLSNAS